MASPLILAKSQVTPGICILDRKKHLSKHSFDQTTSVAVSFWTEVSVLHRFLIWFLTPWTGFSPVGAVLIHPVLPLLVPSSEKYMQ